MREIRIQNKNGRIAIQFSHEKQRYSIYGLGNWDSNSDRDKASLLCRIIQSDILEHRFDKSLAKYKGNLGKATKSLGSPIGHFADFVIESGIELKTFNCHYRPIQKFFQDTNAKIGDCKAVENYFGDVSALTFNMRRGVFRRFGKWLVSEEYLPINPYENLKSRKGSRESVKPFTVDEVNRLNIELSKLSEAVACYYFFCFFTGCRPAEAIGLQWSKVNWVRQEITIDTALARSDSGNPSSKARELKSTKTGDRRVLPIHPKLMEVLKRLEAFQVNAGISSPWVFCDSEGNPLNDVALTRNYWKPAIEAAGLEYRTPYATRHTAASMLLAEGWSVADAAKLLGHKSLAMVSSTYGHSIGDTKMPSYE